MEKVKEFVRDQIIGDGKVAEGVTAAVLEDKVIFSGYGKFHIAVPVTENGDTFLADAGTFLADMEETVAAYATGEAADEALEKEGLPSEGILARTRELEAEAKSFKRAMSGVCRAFRRDYEKEILSEAEWDSLETYRAKHWTGDICDIYASMDEFMKMKELILEDAVKEVVLNPRYCAVAGSIVEFSQLHKGCIG